jgi:methylated-DNA-[protein]-cysteine S-methyltransferase
MERGRGGLLTFYSTLTHPLIGTVLLVTDGQQLIRSSYTDSRLAPEIGEDWKEDPRQPLLKEARSQLKQYLDGKQHQLTVPLRIEGTEFQKQVYQRVLQVPAGTTTTYREIAKDLKKPLAARSIGAAISKNPILIFIPDHRVINRTGSPGGFAGTWNRKPGLLALEKKMAGKQEH